MVIVYLNKNTLEVINEERFEQLVDDEFDKVNKRRTAVKAELETIWLRTEVKAAEVRATCPYTKCIYHVEGGCGAAVTPMPNCYKARADKFMEGVHINE